MFGYLKNFGFETKLWKEQEIRHKLKTVPSDDLHHLFSLMLPGKLLSLTCEIGGAELFTKPGENDTLILCFLLLFTTQWKDLRIL